MLMKSMIDARVVDLPEPVGPIVSTKPCGRRPHCSTIGGSPSSSSDGISKGIILRATATVPFCQKALPRMRALSVHVKAKSTCLPLCRRSVSSSPSRGRTTFSMSAGFNLRMPWRGTRRPSRRSSGGAPAVRWTSVPLRSQSSCRRPSAYRAGVRRELLAGRLALGLGLEAFGGGVPAPGGASLRGSREVAHPRRTAS